MTFMKISFLITHTNSLNGKFFKLQYTVFTTTETPIKMNLLGNKTKILKSVKAEERKIYTQQSLVRITDLLRYQELLFR